MSDGKKIPHTYEQMLAQAAQPVLPNHNPGPAYASHARYFQGIASVERTIQGKLFATWYSGGQGESPLNYVMLAHSNDRGDSWSDPQLVIDPPGQVRTCDSCLWRDPQDRLWLFWTQAHTLHDGRWGVWAITTDQPDADRPKWSEPRRLMDGVMLNKPTVLNDGQWLFSVSMLPSKFIANDRRMLPPFLRRDMINLMSPQEIQAVDARAGALVYATTDQGQTFQYRGQATADPQIASHNEHMIVERQDGSLLMLMRTSQGIAQSVSTDAGSTWSPVTASTIPHVAARFFIRRLISGRLLLVKHGPMSSVDEHGHPIKITRSHLTAYLSENDGFTWQGGLLLQENTCSYPDGTQSNDGTIHIIYDQGRRTEKKIQMARFNEIDILAQKCISPASHCQLLVNQATGVIPPDKDWQRHRQLENGGEQLIFTGI